eukprot:Pompholyxophrys_punicea_v1_NODE_182_length_2964_cov_38.441389.p2 type:complete len:328 gc:universal NODE_182_length_2964_cov_38.441389:1028-45(-)
MIQLQISVEKKIVIFIPESFVVHDVTRSREQICCCHIMESREKRSNAGMKKGDKDFLYDQKKNQSNDSDIDTTYFQVVDFVLPEQGGRGSWITQGTHLLDLQGGQLKNVPQVGDLVQALWKGKMGKVVIERVSTSKFAIEIDRSAFAEDGEEEEPSSSKAKKKRKVDILHNESEEDEATVDLENRQLVLKTPTSPSQELSKLQETVADLHKLQNTVSDLQKFLRLPVGQLSDGQVCLHPSIPEVTICANDFAAVRGSTSLNQAEVCRLTKKLMPLLFTKEEALNSTVTGKSKSGTKNQLDPKRVRAITNFVIDSVPPSASLLIYTPL